MKTEFKKQIEAIPSSDWTRLFELITEIENSKIFGTLSAGEEVANKVFQLPYWDWSDITRRFIQVAYEIKIVLDFDWGNWSEGISMIENGKREFDKLDTLTLCKLMTMILRADRFNDGFLVSNLENGTILKILKALKSSLGENNQSQTSGHGSMIIKTHKFGPKLFNNTRKILVGTLPPETAKMYFSNSTNTRLWDLLLSILNNDTVVAENTNQLDWNQKEEILKKLSLGITDIIQQYSRTDWDSVKDNHIIPIKYNKILKLIENTEVEEILFVYKNAARWFLHSLSKEEPKVISKLKYEIELGVFHELKFEDRTVKCILLPSPLNRGERGQTLPFKLEYYRKIIKT
jgi:G:T/U-mismatch repair DNA glycosylase